MNSDDFAQFLKFFSPDPDEAGRHYNCLYKKLVGFFNLKGVFDPESAADETIDRAIMKISSGAVVPDVEKYCTGIARNLAKEKYRLIQRENSVLDRFIEDLSNSSAEQVERIYNILKPCFEHLAVDDQQLLVLYCQEIQGRARAEHRNQIAEKLETTMLALRVRVTRLRARLTECVKKRSN